MSHVHKRLSDEQVGFVLKHYLASILSRATAQQAPGVGKTQFFALLKQYRLQPEAFSVAYHRSTPPRLDADAELAIRRELERERDLVDNPSLPISGYNYSAVRDRLRTLGIKVSLTTIINRAKALGCYRGHPRHKAHDREVATTATGALIQHDASTHLWSPFATSKWVLVASIDDYSRMLLYAEFVPKESTWAHIQAVRTLVEAYGLPLSYYVDSLRVFRFVQYRDSVWRKQVARTDEVDPQWKQMMRLLGIGVEHALSPQAKGKIERPFSWLQDRIVRTCALERLSTIDEARAVLRAEVDRYNTHQVHSTTKEIPAIRFGNARQLGNSVFRPYASSKPYTSPEDVFCLRETRGPMATAASVWTTRSSMSQASCPANPLNCTWYPTSTSKSCASESGTRASWSAPWRARLTSSEFTFQVFLTLAGDPGGCHPCLVVARQGQEAHHPLRTSVLGGSPALGGGHRLLCPHARGGSIDHAHTTAGFPSAFLADSGAQSRVVISAATRTPVVLMRVGGGAL